MARKIWRVIKICLLSLLGLFAFLIVCAIAFRAIRQHQNSAALAVHTPNGINEAMFVPIGGINQWITIRGTNRHMAKKRPDLDQRAPKGIRDAGCRRPFRRLHPS